MKKTLALIAAVLTMSLSAIADPTYNGIIAYVDGGETAYLLSDQPTVTYRDGSAILTVAGVEVAQVKLEDGQTLTITYGEYEPSAINAVGEEPGKVTRAGKFIKGGRLVIIGKDGKQYDASGVEMKN